MTIYNSVLENHMATRNFYRKDTDICNHDISHNGIPIYLQQISAGLALIIICPLFIILAIIIRLESKGSPVFSQIRVGHNGRRFKFYKFRSMYTKNDKKWIDVTNLESDRDGVCKKFKCDPRITPFGQIIRKLSIDELPQLFNVLKGDMLLIGPRPALCCETHHYDSNAMNRLNAFPGITGLWQVSGRADTTFEQQIKLDNNYIKSQNWFEDVKILLGTIPAVITSKGAY